MSGPAAAPGKGRIAGIDFGTVRIGVAVSNLDQTLASPLDNYTRGGPEADRRYFCRLVEEEQITRFVVGLPVHMSGEESEKSRQARMFGGQLAEWTGLPVDFFDERLTTAAADELLAGAKLTKKQRQARRDKLAAQILLASYLESTRRAEPPERLEDEGR